MAALREMVAPRHASSQRSCSGVNRSGMGRARGIGRGDGLTSVVDCDTVGKQLASIHGINAVSQMRGRQSVSPAD